MTLSARMFMVRFASVLGARKGSSHCICLGLYSGCSHQRIGMQGAEYLGGLKFIFGD